METDQVIIKKIKENGALSLPERATLLTNFLTKQNIWQVAQIEMALTVKGSIERGLQINSYVSDNGGRDAMKLIMMLISNTAMFFNVNNNLNEHQMVQIAQAIIGRFGYDNIEDIVLALKDARMGLCEKVYGRIDGEVILGWIERYMERKSEELEKIHHQHKTKSIELSPEIAKIAAEIAQKTTPPEPPVKPFAQTAENWLKWFDEFKTTLPVKDLKAIRFDLETNNIFRDGVYEDTISWINERIANAPTH